MNKGFSNYHPLEVHTSAIVLLFNGMIQKLNSIECLIENKQYDSVDVLKRTMLEYSVSLAYILERRSFTKQRGRAFFYSFHYQAAKNAQKFLDGNFKDFDSELIKIKLDQQISDSANRNFKNLSEYLLYMKTKYRECFMINGQEPKKVEKRMKSWFNQDGRTRTFYDLCVKLGREGEYRAFYSFGSLDTHGLSEISNLRIVDGEVVIGNLLEPISNLELCKSWLLKAAEVVVDYLQIKTIPEVRNILLQLLMNLRN